MVGFEFNELLGFGNFNFFWVIGEVVGDCCMVVVEVMLKYVCYCNEFELCVIGRECVGCGVCVMIIVIY